MARVAWLVLVLAWLPGVAGAQAREEAGPPLSLGAGAAISVLTVEPGDEVYTHFGHIAFRVRDPRHDRDVVFGYGTFDFAQPYFVPRFVRGELDYFLDVRPFAEEFDAARETDRAMVEQELALTAAQRDLLWRFLIANLRPENRTYRYRFLIDNCATRVRDGLQQSLGQDLHWNLAAPQPPRSYRQMLRPYLAHVPWLDLGIDLGLGLPAEQKVSAWDALFLPDPLRQALARATIEQDGRTVPLVAATRVLLETHAVRAGAPATPWPALLFWAAFAGAVAWTAWTRRRSGRGARAPDAVLLIAVGLVGLLLLFLWVGTEHDAARANLNLLWAWPTHLVVGVLLWWRRAAAWRWVRWYLAATAAVTLVVAGLWFVLPQHLPAALLPVALMVAVRMGVRAWRREVAEEKRSARSEARIKPGRKR